MKRVFGVIASLALATSLMLAAIPTVAANGAICACEVIDVSQGIQVDGQPVQPSRSDTDEALGAPDATSVGGWQNFYALGFDAVNERDDNDPDPGWMILKFCSPVAGTLAVYECSPVISYGYPDETANIYVSQNTTDWVLLGEAKNNVSTTSVQHASTFDIGLAWIQYVKIVDTTDVTLHTGTADAFDIDAVCASEVYVNTAPDVTNAYATPNCTWPPNHKFVDVEIMGVTDPDGDEVTIVITGITSDEPTATDEGSGGIKHAPDADGVGTATASVRAERSGDGDGRVYVINFTAIDESGGQTTGSVQVKVPHDQAGKGCEAVDSGQNYDATAIN